MAETHFKNKNCTKNLYYSIYYTEHSKGTDHTGTAITIKSSLTHHEVPKYAQNYLQATTIQKTSCSSHYFICILPSKIEYHQITYQAIFFVLIRLETSLSVEEMLTVNTLTGAPD